MNNDNDHRNGTTHQHERLGKLTYSVAEAAAVTGLGRTTLFALMRSGTLNRPGFVGGSNS
jgi:predicted DNA-binding transcriptional regulator AlpA